MKVITEITNGALTEGTYVEGTSTGYAETGRVLFCSTWAGTFDGIRLDDHDGEEDYAYFMGGHINGTAQGIHGFPAARLKV